MAKYILGSVLLVWITSSMGDVSVRGYTKSDGTYVAPHYRSDPNGNFNDNWSTKPNVNPYTGQEGSKANPNYGSDSRRNQPNTQPRSNSSYDTGY